MPAKSAAYDDDLAYIHDVGYTEFARRSAPGLLALLNHAGIESGRVVDLGCGSGVWADELLCAGYDVTGYDISPSMIKLAKRRAPEGDFHAESFVTADLPTCRAVTALGEVLNYRFDPQHSSAALDRLFRRVYRALEPGGLFVFDVAEPGRGSGATERATEGPDWACLVWYESTATTLTRQITTFRKAQGTGRNYRRRTETHELRLYRGADLARRLRKIGFRARTVRSYGSYDFPPAYVALVARKPA